MKKIVSTDKAPAAIGPYSQAVQAGQFLFASGQIPLDPKTGKMVSGSVEDQAVCGVDHRYLFPVFQVSAVGAGVFF